MVGLVVVSAMSKEELFVWVIDLLAEMFELDKSALTLDSNLYVDLDIDSIDAVDLAVKLKQMTGIRLQPEVFKQIRTIGDVINTLSGVKVDPIKNDPIQNESAA